jgi:hypothetical protein
MKRALAALLIVWILAGLPAAAADIPRLDAAVPEIPGVVMTLTNVMPYYARGPHPADPARTVYTLYFEPEGTVRFSRSVDLAVFDLMTLVESVVTVEAGTDIPVSAISGGRLAFDDGSGFVCFVSMGDALRAAGFSAASCDIAGLGANGEAPPGFEQATAWGGA